MLVIACAQAETTPTPLPTVTPTTTPTLVPTPTPTPTHTPTPVTKPALTLSPSPRVSLPADDGPHQTNTEWWYYNGHLVGEDSSRYGFHYVFFKFQSPTSQFFVLLGQFALTDHQRRTFTHDFRFGAGPQDEILEGFRVELSDWGMSGFAGEFDLKASQADYAIDLHLSAAKPAVLHDDDGVVEFQVTGDSYYYSYTSLEITGTLTDHSTTRIVTGTAWMDHQWGDFQITDINWDWFSLQLEDNTEVMFAEVRDQQGNPVISFGTYVDAEGNAVALSQEEFTVRATSAWHSPHSNTEYPSGWTVDILPVGLSLTLTPVVLDAEVYVAERPPLSYWEGEVQVFGERNGASIGGVGFVELAGYVGSFKTGMIPTKMGN